MNYVNHNNAIQGINDIISGKEQQITSLDNEIYTLKKLKRSLEHKFKDKMYEKDKTVG